LAGGGRLAVDGAVGLARAFHVSEALIGLTLVAVGTSLPELVASAMATLRGQADLAVGNVVGSNIFNLLFVGGVTAVIRPIRVPPGGHWDLWFLAAMSGVLLPLSISNSRSIVRLEGAALLAAYLAYTAWRCLVAPGGAG
ncbi:sodium:calcium antiporter, partial [Dissulfurirhabdus thermomarina]|nr:sodium:calcium antiporter [Dissulfurirhabdus thermomarina]